MEGIGLTLVDLIRKMTAPLRVRIANMVARAVVRLADDSGGIQSLQLDILDGETRDGIERIQQYGLTSRPLDGAEAVVLFVDGSREHGLIVSVDDRRYRVASLEPGEVCLYNDQGAKATLKADGSIEVTAAAGQDIVLNSGSAKVSRVGDQTAGHTHTYSWTGIPGSGVTGSATDTMAEGADHVKA